MRFRIDGHTMDAGLAKVKLTEQIRAPAGGVTLVLKVPVEGAVKARKASGGGQLRFKVSQLFERDGAFILAVKVKPKGPTKAALKKGAKLNAKIAVTYTPEASNKVSGPPKTTIFNVTLKKVPGVE